MSFSNDNEVLEFFDCVSIPSNYVFSADYVSVSDCVSPMDSVSMSDCVSVPSSSPEASIITILGYLLSFHLTTSLSQIGIFVVNIISLWWDLRALFAVQPTPSKHTSQQLLRSYPRRWMILSCYMLLHFTRHCIHPVSAHWTTFMHHLQLTHQTSLALEETMDLAYPPNWVAIHHAKSLEFQMVQLSLASSSPSYQSPPLSPASVVVSPPTLPTSASHYFLCYESLQEMEETCVTMDYFDCHFDVSPSIDPFATTCFDFTQDDPDHAHVYCAYDSFLSDDLPSPAGLNAALMGNVDLLPSATPSTFRVIFDSGASLAISPNKDHFVGPIQPCSKFLGGLANGMKIEGIGTIQWSFKSSAGLLTIHSKCYYVPNAKACLISPQRLFKASEGVTGAFIVKENKAELTFDGVGTLSIPYDDKSYLPIATAKNFALGGVPQANMILLDEENQNLSASQKLLLLWHHKFAHKSMKVVQVLLRKAPFISDRFLRASRCSLPKCDICEFAKAHRQPTKGAVQSKNLLTDGTLKSGDLRPGASVSTDHFESRVKGRTLNSFGRPGSAKYVGGCIFVDHMSSYIHVEFQHGFSSSETLRAKQAFEKLALDYGVLVDSYLADNGVFKANAFVQHINQHGQKLRFCGVNAHHQNGVAERSIRTVSEMARAMLLHSSLHWKSGIDSSLWPLAVSHAAYIYNHLPNSHDVCPADLFTGTTVPRHHLLQAHVWGCPVYVLDPQLQQGKKLPRWQPRARRGVFVGYSPSHSSNVPLILNLQTGSISPQFHVVFDDAFSTVASVAPDDAVPEFWNEVDLDAHILRVPFDSTESAPPLSREWLSPDELEERHRQEIRSAEIRKTYDQNSSSSSPLLSSSSTSVVNSQALEEPPKHSSQSWTQQASSTSKVTILHDSAPSVLGSFQSPPLQSNAPSSKSTQSSAPSSQSTVSTPSLRRTTRKTAGTWASEKYTPEAFFASITDPSLPHHIQQLAYQAALETDFITGEDNCTDARAFIAKHKSDPDNPTLSEAMNGPHAAEYEKAMIKEIRQLVQIKAWKYVLRSSVPHKHPILKGTWAFKLKRRPDGTPLKFKARYCVRGDLQREGVDYFETYAPVVQWSTVRLLLTLILSHNWVTKQVDYTNAFAQAKLNETVFIEAPKGFGWGDGKDKVLQLINSLYGLKQAPKTFYDKLSEGLIQRGFVKSDHDHCLFMKKNMICVIYVDDTIIAGPNVAEIESLIKDLGISKYEERHTFELRDEGEVGDFLGIRIEKRSSNSFYLSQPGLTEKVISEAKLESANSAVTPVSTTPIGSDKDGAPFQEEWDYATVIGMLMYLAQNSRPDISYAVHSCARFTHCPKQSHATAVKRIIRYLIGTKDKGLILSPSQTLEVDCYVDADFAGLWSVEDPNDSICVKSRSGHLIMFMGCPLLWKSKLQTQIALSTMEAEYIALSLAMRDLIAIRGVIKEIGTNVFPSVKDSAFGNIPTSTTSRAFGEVPQSIVYEDNQSCLKFATMPKMSPRTKHIAIPYHFFRTQVKNLEIAVKAISTDNQLADQFTKGLPQDKFLRDRKLLMGW